MPDLSNQLKSLIERFYQESEDHPTSELPLSLLSQIETEVHESIEGESGYEQISNFVEKFNRSIQETTSPSEARSLEEMLIYLIKRVESILDETLIEDLDSLLEKLDILHIKLNRVILRPDTLENTDRDKEESDAKERPTLEVSKLKLLLQVLRELDVFPEDIVVLSGIVTDRMMREKTYLIIEIPSLNKIVLLNEGYGEASFVVPTMLNRSEFVKNGKINILELGATKVIFQEEHVQEWKARMTDLLKGEKNTVDTKTLSVEREAQFEAETIRDKAYYENPKFVRYDLEAFAVSAGLESPLMLPTGSGVKTCLSNGEIITFASYLTKAGFVFKLGATYKEASGNQAKARNKLLELSGFNIRNQEYYNNQDFVLRDLEAFAAAANIKSPLELMITFRGATVISNGEQITFTKYLGNVAIMFGMAAESIESYSKLAIARDKLLEIAGLKTPSQKPKIEIERDQAYYNNSKFVRHDLKAYAAVAEGVEHPLQLTTGLKAEVKLSNGETVKFLTYLDQAGISLGIEKKFAKIRDALLKIAGYNKRDESYFNNPQFVNTDLLAFTAASGKNDQRELAISEQIEARISNGESLKWRTYWVNAGVTLGIAANAREAGEKGTAIKAHLIKIAKSVE